MAERVALVLLGATGDLTKRKLLPGLYHIYKLGLIDHSTVIIGSGRTTLSDLSFRAKFDFPDNFKSMLYYHTGIEGLKAKIKTLFEEDSTQPVKTVIFCALPPTVYAETAAALKREGFGDEATIIIEKPFGTNLESAIDLDKSIAKYFAEKQIYRIDHYLAKEAVRNLLTLRFANPIFSTTWRTECIESIQISATESIGVEGRGAYFDKSGIIRDMVQNHLLQMTALACMEAPLNMSASEIQRCKLEFIRSLKVVRYARAQYNGYRLEPSVAANSNTETFVEMVLESSRERWIGCPIYIRAGKACVSASADIGITFKKMCCGPYASDSSIPRNKIMVKIQPEPGIILNFATRTPGGNEDITETTMNLCYNDAFTHDWTDAYEKLLLDAIKGDKTLFVSAAETEAAWELLDPILDKGDLFYYERGETPASPLGIKWINFENYCSRNG